MIPIRGRPAMRWFSKPLRLFDYEVGISLGCPLSPLIVKDSNPAHKGYDKEA
jgi:hypothetical protein